MKRVPVAQVAAEGIDGIDAAERDGFLHANRIGVLAWSQTRFYKSASVFDLFLESIQNDRGFSRVDRFHAPPRFFQINDGLCERNQRLNFGELLFFDIQLTEFVLKMIL